MPEGANNGLRLRRLGLTALSVLSFFSLAGVATAAQVGVNSDITWGISPSEVNQEVALTVKAGITWIRASVDLSDAEPSAPGALDANYIAQIDSEIQAARNAGLNVLMEFDRTPYWASADPSRYTDSSGLHWNHYYKYRSVQDYANIVATLVSHYRALGVHAYELWNEPNLINFWPSGPNATEYTQLLKAAYPAVKAADPASTVVMGGLSNKGSYAFLQGMYSAGAKGSYDAANFHIYPEGDPTQCLMVNGRPYEGSFCLLSGLRSVMSANGDSAPVWVTEIGWSTCTQDSPCFTQQQQASYVSSAYQLLGTSNYAWVQAAFVYQMRDLYWETSNASWGSSLGLVDRNFNPKPAYYAVQALGSSAGGGGTPVPPAVSLTAPTSGSSIGSSVTAAATATSPSGITKVTFSIDGKLAATDTSAPYTANLSTKKLANGSHVVSATAYDALGLQTSASATVYKGTATTAVTSAADPAGSLTLHVRGASVLSASGTLRGVAAGVPGHVRLVLQRRRAGAWHTVRVAQANLVNGHFRRTLRLQRGVWRVRARFRSVSSAVAVLRLG